MSEENIAVLRAVLESWDPGLWVRGEAGKDRGLAMFDPEVTYEDTVLPDHVGEVYRGAEGVARAAERWAEPYESLTLELEDIVEVGKMLVSSHRVRAKARQTGIEFDATVAYVWTFRDRKVIGLRSYGDLELGLEAARAST